MTESELPKACDIALDLHEVQRIELSDIRERKLSESANPYYVRDLVIGFKSGHHMRLTLFAKHVTDLLEKNAQSNYL